MIALSAAACTANSGPPTAEDTGSPAPTARQIAAACQAADVVTSSAPGTATWTFTAIRKVTPDDATPAPEVDQPLTAGVDWESPVDTDTAVSAIENALGYVASGTSDTLVELDRFLSGVRELRAYVGYAAVEKVSVPVTADCRGGGGTVAGVLSTWSDAETGVVVCATRYAKGEASAVALRAQAEFCD
ncbi:hypothetical protein Xph01_05420 [Micromonospora phaseoli]|nr:hypothetical protein Xph01_05420 [Micromonospora phaseoli]